MRAALFLSLILLIPACSLGAPELDASITETSRAAPWPDLVPLGPLLVGAAALTPRTAEAEGRSLEARAADLRRRAARLRALPLG
ncbi:MAG: hypothetical protein COW55_11890 [Rhodobacteraceae bacterium CG17_big_fil_post_rev_8_21_14_2_50_65_11]|nr:MAG: hypothetical protein COW55_11890 [Rhodobacteraceae bacterium CG17_big_fil_post_rev_8_21_14_2_50_65_11]